MRKKKTSEPIVEPEKKRPTDKQLATLLFVADTIDGAGYSPPYRKIAARFGIAVRPAFLLVEALSELGLVHTANDADSGIEITDDGREIVMEWREKTVEIT